MSSSCMRGEHVSSILDRGVPGKRILGRAFDSGCCSHLVILLLGLLGTKKVPWSQQHVFAKIRGPASLLLWVSRGDEVGRSADRLVTSSGLCYCCGQSWEGGAEHHLGTSCVRTNIHTTLSQYADRHFVFSGRVECGESFNCIDVNSKLQQCTASNVITWDLRNHGTIGVCLN